MFFEDYSFWTNRKFIFHFLRLQREWMIDFHNKKKSKMIFFQEAMYFLWVKCNETWWSFPEINVHFLACGAGPESSFSSSSLKRWFVFLRISTSSECYFSSFSRYSWSLISISLILFSRASTCFCNSLHSTSSCFFFPSISDFFYSA